MISSSFWRFSLLVCCLGVYRPMNASDCGWILWENTNYLSVENPDAHYEDRWTFIDGYDTATDCHAAGKVRDELNKIINQRTAVLKPVSHVTTTKCFPVEFDPRERSKP